MKLNNTDPHHYLKNFNWKFVIVAALCILFWCLMLGCGTHAELAYNPVTEVWDIYYHNNRLFAPEDITIKSPDGWTFIIGEQAGQRDFYGSLIGLGASMAGGEAVGGLVR